jgi:hypothetical protein
MCRAKTKLHTLPTTDCSRMSHLGRRERTQTNNALPYGTPIMWRSPLQNHKTYQAQEATNRKGRHIPGDCCQGRDTQTLTAQKAFHARNLSRRRRFLQVCNRKCFHPDPLLSARSIVLNASHIRTKTLATRSASHQHQPTSYQHQGPARRAKEPNQPTTPTQPTQGATCAALLRLPEVGGVVQVKVLKRTVMVLRRVQIVIGAPPRGGCIQVPPASPVIGASPVGPVVAVRPPPVSVIRPVVRSSGVVRLGVPVAPV